MFDVMPVFLFLLLSTFILKFLHSRPMELRTAVVLGVVAIIKPDQIIPFVVGAYSPGDRLIGVASVMKEISVQVGAAMPKIVKREKEDPKLPIQHEANCYRCSKHHDLRDSPSRIDRVLSFNFGVDGFWIFAQIAEENITPRVFRLAVVPMSINGNPVVRMSVLIRAIAISHMVPVMHMFIESLRDAEGH